MTTFIGIKKEGKRTFAILEDFEMLKADKPSLRTRIRNLKRHGTNTREEEKALAAIEEAENGNV